MGLTSEQPCTGLGSLSLLSHSRSKTEAFPLCDEAPFKSSVQHASPPAPPKRCFTYTTHLLLCYTPDFQHLIPTSHPSRDISSNIP